MQEKYHNWLHYTMAYSYRAVIRSVLAGLVQWPKPASLQRGCTAIIGMCSKLPFVLPANLSCLQTASWPGLKEVVVAVDSTPTPFLRAFARQVQNQFPQLRLRFVYYTPKQFALTEAVKLPYAFCWLSWCIAIATVQTEHFFIHDYDALLLGSVLEDRYQHFMDANRLVQGVLWYWTNGISSQDRLASTFEAFVDTAWVRRHRPIDLFNQIGRLNGRRVDFDILLDMQAHDCSPSQRGIMEMTEEELIHPTQMIHQYTVFRKFPRRPWHCSATLMIPFFYYLSGRRDIFKSAVSRMRRSGTKILDLLEDGCEINFSQLKAEHLNRMLRLMVQGFVRLRIKPFGDFFDYGNSFYDWAAVPASYRWNFSQTPSQREWIYSLAQ